MHPVMPSCVPAGLLACWRPACLGHPLALFAIRQVALSTKLNMSFVLDADGGMHYVSKLPMVGPLRIRAVDGACLELSMLGTKMRYSVRWVGGVWAHHLPPQAAAWSEISHAPSTHLVHATSRYRTDALEMIQVNTTGKTTTTATITQRYDAARDRIVSENDSVEGFYMRTFRRVS